MTGQAGDNTESMDDIIDTYAGMVYRLSYAQTRNQHDAEDIFQEVFLRYVRKAPPFESEAHRKAWFIRVTVNCAKSLHTSAWHRKTSELKEEIVFEMPEQTLLSDALTRLPSKFRAVLHLFYYEGYSTQQIGTLLGKSPSAVRMQLTRARAKLKEVLKGEYPYE